MFSNTATNVVTFPLTAEVHKMVISATALNNESVTLATHTGQMAKDAEKAAVAIRAAAHALRQLDLDAILSRVRLAA